MALVPPLPKDWDRWVSKVGVEQNYMFYQYRRGGTKTGYCSYCDREVPIRKPKHNAVDQMPQMQKNGAVQIPSARWAGCAQGEISCI